MATATKTSRVKNKKKVNPSESNPEEIEGESDVLPAKATKALEIDEPEVAVGIIEEKVDEDPLLTAAEDAEEAEEVGLDKDELNPFGDRWEE